MIRSFDWRDVGLVKTLTEQGVCLDSETALTHGPHPLQGALLDYLMPGVGMPTLIWRPSERNGDTGSLGAGRAVIGQLHHRLGRRQAQVMFMAPQATQAAEGWLELMERLAQMAGERGAHNLLAEVNEDSAEFEALRSAGFAIYARQSVWKLPAQGQPLTASVAVPLRPAVSADAFAVSTLYSNIVPRLIQQVEQPPHRIERGYVLEQHSELIAYLDVRRGPLGIWVKPYLHPEVYDLSDAVLQAGLSQLKPGTDKPVYVCVPRYEDWLQEVVARAGFEARGSQAVMVKRLAVGLTEARLKPLPAVDGQITTPAAQITTTPHAERLAAGNPSLRWLNYAKTNYGRSARSDERDSPGDWRGPGGRQPHRRTARSHPGFGPRAHSPLH
jgi:hypothetical protein